MQSLDVFNAIKLMRLRRFTPVHLTDSLIAVLLQIRSVGEVSNDPSERVAEVDAGSD